MSREVDTHPAELDSDSAGVGSAAEPLLCCTGAAAGGSPAVLVVLVSAGRLDSLVAAAAGAGAAAGAAAGATAGAAAGVAAGVAAALACGESRVGRVDDKAGSDVWDKSDERN